MKFYIEIDGPDHLLVHTDHDIVKKQMLTAARSITGMCPVGHTAHGASIALVRDVPESMSASDAREALRDWFASDPYIKRGSSRLMSA
jgi:hypothetical protein